MDATSEIVEFARAAKDLALEQTDARLADLRGELTIAVARIVREEVAKLESEYRRFRAGVEGKLSGGRSDLIDAFRASLQEQPAPQVIIPESAITVVAPAPPDVVVPPDAIRVEIVWPDKMELTLKPRKTVVVKEIVYGGDGRPSKIVETTTEE